MSVYRIYTSATIWPGITNSVKAEMKCSCLPKEPSSREFNSRFDNYFLHTLKSVVQDFFLLESAVSVLHAEEATEN